jgi:predicted transcriptional regulator
MSNLKKAPAMPVPVALDAELLAEIDAVAADVKDSRSGVMRRAIRAGLPLVKSGGEVVRLSGELADSVGELVARFAEIPGQKRTRDGVLAEAIQRGFRAVELQAMIEDGRARGMDEASLHGVLASHGLDTYPEKRTVREALLAKGALEIQLADLLANFPGAAARQQAIQQLIELRRAAGFWPKVWGCGLSTAEIQWEISMRERHGPDSAQWPKEEVERREREREAEAAARQAATPDGSQARATAAAAKPAASKSAKRKASK